MLKTILRITFLVYLILPNLGRGETSSKVLKDTTRSEQTTPETLKNTEVNNNPLQLLLTIYRNSALVKRTFKLPLEVGSHTYTLNGIASTLFPWSLKLDLRSALKISARIEEYSLKPYKSEETEKNLEVIITSAQNDPHNQVDLQYFFKELGWKIEYSLQLASTYDSIELNSWIELNNQSEIDYNDARILLVDSEAPDITIEDPYSLKGSLTPDSPIYKIPRLVNLPRKSPKKVSWLSSANTRVQQQYKLHVGKEYLIDLNGKGAKPLVEIWISFLNDEQNGLGSAMPPGKAIVFYQRLKDNPEILGFVDIPYTPANQMVNLRLPISANNKQMTIEGSPINSFVSIDTDLEQNEYKKLTDKITEANYRLCLKNKGYQTTTVQVILDLPTGNCKVIKENKLHRVESSKQFSWSIEVPAQSEVDLKYRLRIDLNE